MANQWGRGLLVMGVDHSAYYVKIENDQKIFCSVTPSSKAESDFVNMLSIILKSFSIFLGTRCFKTFGKHFSC